MASNVPDNEHDDKYDVIKESPRQCDICEKGDIVASKRCQQCSTNMCPACCEDHNGVDILSGHTIKPLTQFLFCGAHKDVVVSIYCVDCKAGVCRTCVVRTHRKHNCKELQQIAQDCRERLKEFLKSPTIDRSTGMITSLQVAAGKLRATHSQRNGEIRALRNCLHATLAKLVEVESEMEALVNGQLCELANQEKELVRLDSSRSSLSRLANGLLEDGSDIEVTSKVHEFPDSLAFGERRQHRIAVPDIDRSLGEMIKRMADFFTNCRVITESKILLPAEPISRLFFVREFTVSSRVDSLCLTMENGDLRIVLRTLDHRAPFKVFDYQGTLQKEFGKSIAGIFVKTPRHIAIDTKRNLYLAPCRNKLVRFNMQGAIYDEIIANGDLRGIAYDCLEDMYIVSVTDQHKICVIDAEKKLLVREFGIKQGDDLNDFKFPNSLRNYREGNDTAVIVTDLGNHRIQVCDTRGRHIQTYGGPGNGTGELSEPIGVCVDPTGRLLVCDAGNCRLLSCWSEGGDVKWKTLLARAQLGGKPRYIDINFHEKHLIIATENNKILVYSYQ